MKICLVTPEYVPAPGGIASYYHALAELLSAAGHQVRVLTLGAASGDERVLSFQSSVEAIVRSLSRRGYPYWYCKAVGHPGGVEHALRELHETFDFDVVETTDTQALAAAVTLGRWPVVVTSHGSRGQVLAHSGMRTWSPGQRLVSRLEVQALATADAVCAYSPANAADWSATLDREVTFVRPPVSIPATAPWKHQARERIRALGVGRLNNWKGIFELVEAWDALRAEGIALDVTWIGRDQDAPEERVASVAEYIAEKAGDDYGTSFRWIPDASRAELRRERMEADFAVVPSRWDTFNFTATEALADGVPLLVSTGAGASYLCKDGCNAIVVPPRDAAELAAGLRRMIGANRAEIGAAGAATVRDELAADKTIADRLALYERAIERHSHRRRGGYSATAPAALVPPPGDRLSALGRRVRKLWRRPNG